MTTETKNNKINNQTGEQSTFAPLGKYAFIAVIMVGIIVTTAIMLNQQLNKAETEIASIEDEIAELNKVQAQASETSNADRQVQMSAEETITTTSATATEMDATIENSSVINSQQSDDAAIAMSGANTSTDDTATIAAANVNAYPSHKTQQKVRMTEMFDRIRQLESKQLEQFKTQQAEQVARLRNRVATQQHQIDALIQRNENLFNLRSASVQRNQAQREQMLNRI